MKGVESPKFLSASATSDLASSRLEYSTSESDILPVLNPQPPRMSHVSSTHALQSSKKKRKRTTPDQLKTLETIFDEVQHPNLALRNQLAAQLGMTPRSVQVLDFMQQSENI